MFADKAALGPSIVAVTLVVHPFVSVMITTYGPAARFVAVGPVWTGLVFQANVYSGVPPLAVTVAVPFVPPKQLTFCCPLMSPVSGSGPVMSTLALAEVKSASVTVTV
jgi:hypothetical protein